MKKSLLFAAGLTASLVVGEGALAKQEKVTACNHVDSSNMVEVTHCAREQLRKLHLPHGTVQITVYNPATEDMQNITLKRREVLEENKCGVMKKSSEYQLLQPGNISVDVEEAHGIESVWNVSGGYIPVATHWRGDETRVVSVATAYHPQLATNAAIQGGKNVIQRAVNNALAELSDTPSRSEKGKVLPKVIKEKRFDILARALLIMEHLDDTKTRQCDGSAISSLSEAMRKESNRVFVQAHYNGESLYSYSSSKVGAQGAMQVMPNTARELQEKYNLDGNLRTLSGAMQYTLAFFDNAAAIIKGNVNHSRMAMAYNQGPSAQGISNETRGYLIKFNGLLKSGILGTAHAQEISDQKIKKPVIQKAGGAKKSVVKNKKQAAPKIHHDSKKKKEKRRSG